MALRVTFRLVMEGGPVRFAPYPDGPVQQKREAANEFVVLRVLTTVCK